ncbi:guanyl-nucleotide exchange factor, putative [Entamoeba invadens IP1]|uniref:guanyl-nucleotide exchange factor, putative n=1 Tax=Entamoeba invadens IP1 TaxID=370355 RepID=UPI0002C3D3D2|nr:guanyl-nucleotide exchange factor, putative [Entamoeba invadens IP1]ELP85345.1 guanyl-nucleotide exchange factor, putative [Entamoeba invadens IP1]|eukprot:XP_004184691.1 guanyl-nucleotide exchange factor, putative [Entamoeba invadens IP1]
MADSFPLKTHLTHLQTFVDKKNKTFQEVFNQTITSLKPENVFDKKTQSSLVECMRCALTIEYTLRQSDKLVQAIQVLCNTTFILNTSMEQILDTAFSFLTAHVIKSNKRLVQFTVSLIDLSLPFELDKMHILENFKVLSDLYVTSPAQDMCQIMRVQNKLILHVFVQDDKADESILLEDTSITLDNGVNMPRLSITGKVPLRERALSVNVKTSPRFKNSLNLKNTPNDDIFVKPKTSASPGITSKIDKPEKTPKGRNSEEEKKDKDEKEFLYEDDECLQDDTDTEEDSSHSTSVKTNNQLDTPRSGIDENEDKNENTIQSNSTGLFSSGSLGNSSGEEFMVRDQLMKLKRATTKIGSDLQRVCLGCDTPAHLEVLNFITKETTCDHSKKPFFSKSILGSPWNELRGKRPMVLKMEKRMLELLKYWLEKSPDCCAPTAINGWNMDICVSIVKNIFGEDKTNFVSALSIFSAIATKFREHMQNEVGYVTKHVLEFFLKSPFALVTHKLLMLTEMKKMFQENQLLVDLFFNNDCVKNGEDVFGDLLNCLIFVMTPEFKVDCPEEVTIKMHDSIKKECLGVISEIVDSIELLKNNVIINEQNGFVEIDKTEGKKTVSPQGLQLLADWKMKIYNLKAKELFKESPSEAVKFMISSKLCEENPKSVAQFLMEMPQIDKTSLGKYLTSNKEFNETVFKEYMSLIDFKGQGVDSALRTMFGLFVMPGEGQVVDRVMEHFAARYAECFKKELDELQIGSSQVYFLATTIIFLSTETHNANVKTRTMDTYEKFKGMVEQFKFTLPDDYLKPLYDSVTQNAFLIPEQKVEEKHDNKVYVNEIKTNPRQRGMILIMTSELADFAKNGMIPPRDTVMLLSRDILKAFLDTAVPILLKYFKLVFEDNVAETVRCLKSVIEATILMECFDSTAKIMNFICSFSVYANFTPPKEVNYKATKLVLELCESSPEHLHQGWVDAFTVFSRLEQMGILDHPSIPPLTGIPKNTRKLFFMEVQHKLYSPKDLKIGFPIAQELTVIKNQLKPETELLNNIFTKLALLGQNEFTEMIKCLSKAALVELNCFSPPMFLLNRFEEIVKGYFEKGEKKKSLEMVDAIREFLLQCGLHPHINVAKKAVSTFFEFSQRDVFSEYTSKLKPIVVLMCDTPLLQCRSYILDVLKSELKTLANYVASSWKEILEVLYVASLDENIDLVKSGYDTLSIIVEDKIPYDEKNTVYMLKTLVKYGLIKDKSVVQDKRNEPMIIAGVTHVLEKFKVEDIDLETDGRFFESFFDVLRAYRKITASPFIIFTSLAAQAISNTVDKFCNKITEETWWFIINKIYFKILEEVGYYHRKDESLVNTRPDEWWSSVCLTSFMRMSNYILQHPDKLSGFIGDVFHIGVVFSLQGFVAAENIGLMIIKMTQPFFVENKEFIVLYNMIVSNVCEYIYQYVLSQKEKNVKKEEKEVSVGTPQKETPEADKCSNCGKELSQFEVIHCPLCEDKFCCVECKREKIGKEHHQIVKKKNIEEHFYPVTFSTPKLDFPTLTISTSKLFGVLEDNLNKLVTVSKEEDEKVMISLIEYDIKVMAEIKLNESDKQNVTDVSNSVEYFLIAFARAVGTVFPEVVVGLLDKFLAIPSETMLSFLFQFINSCTKELMNVIYKQNYRQLISLVSHESKEIRESLSAVLLNVYNAAQI